MAVKAKSKETGKTILLVEDDQFLQKVLKARLEKGTSYNVVVATDGEEAVEQVKKVKEK